MTIQERLIHYQEKTQRWAKGEKAYWKYFLDIRSNRKKIKVSKWYQDYLRKLNQHHLHGYGNELARRHYY